jgi:hypothetical protein
MEKINQSKLGIKSSIPILLSYNNQTFFVKNKFNEYYEKNLKEASQKLVLTEGQNVEVNMNDDRMHKPPTTTPTTPTTTILNSLDTDTYEPILKGKSILQPNIDFFAPTNTLPYRPKKSEFAGGKHKKTKKNKKQNKQTKKNKKNKKTSKANKQKSKQTKKNKK